MDRSRENAGATGNYPEIRRAAGFPEITVSPVIQRKEEVADECHGSFALDVHHGHGESLFAYCDKVMQAMLDLERCTPGFGDPAVSADAKRGVVEIEANATGEDLSHAIATVQATVRAALLSVGIGTPDWPTHHKTLSMVLKDLQTVQV